MMGTPSIGLAFGDRATVEPARSNEFWQNLLGEDDTLVFAVMVAGHVPLANPGHGRVPLASPKSVLVPEKPTARVCSARVCLSPPQKKTLRQRSRRRASARRGADYFASRAALLDTTGA